MRYYSYPFHRTSWRWRILFQGYNTSILSWWYGFSINSFSSKSLLQYFFDIKIILNKNCKFISYCRPTYIKVGLDSVYKNSSRIFLKPTVSYTITEFVNCHSLTEIKTNFIPLHIFQRFILGYNGTKFNTLAKTKTCFEDGFDNIPRNIYILSMYLHMCVLYMHVSDNTIETTVMTRFSQFLAHILFVIQLDGIVNNKTIEESLFIDLPLKHEVFVRFHF